MNTERSTGRPGRGFVLRAWSRGIAAAACAGLLVVWAAAASSAAPIAGGRTAQDRPQAGAKPDAKDAGPERLLLFYNTHSQEHLAVVYKRGTVYDPEGLAKINHILRDAFDNEEHPIDPVLLDFLYDLLEKVDYHGEVHIVCGYRSEQTNKMLHKKTSGVALGSQHTKGRAIDIRLPGVDTKKLYEAAKAMQRGGTGYYKGSDFIQIDTGPVRCW
jgi:uncharacterized protein YcbK (DUF882 family)